MGGELRSEIIKETYRAERDFQRAIEDLGPLDTPEDIQRVLGEARAAVSSEEALRAANEASGALKEEADVDWSGAEIVQFANDALDTAERIVANPGP